MRIVFTGGGTGGHIFPNIAIRRSRPLADVASVYYIGEKHSLEEKICQEEGITFFSIHSGKLRRYFSLRTVVDVFKIPVGVFESWRLLGKIKPRLVFSKGGYVSVPVVIAAYIRKIPVWLHESDVSRGLSTKICSRFAKKIFLSFEESRRYFRHKKIEVVGNPIRAEVTQGKKERGYKFAHFTKDLPVVLFMGGSLGAQSLNNLLAEILPELLRKAQVLHVTGTAPFKAPKLPSPLSLHYLRVAFLNKELFDVYAIADLIVTRAGSGSLFEALAVNKPLLLIPLPRSASRGDQIENAEVFEEHGWAQVVQQEDLTPNLLMQKIEQLLFGEKVRSDMMKKQKEAQHLTHGAQLIAKQLAV